MNDGFEVLIWIIFDQIIKLFWITFDQIIKFIPFFPQVDRQAATIQELDTSLSDAKQHVIVLEDQVDSSKNENEKLDLNLNSLKQKYNQSMNELAHLDNTVKTLQEKLAESRNKELDKDQRIDSLKTDMENLDRMYTDTKHEVKKCEDVIEQLTQEFSTSQEDLSVAQARMRENEDNIRNLKDRVQDLTAEVCIYIYSTNKGIRR